MAINQQTISTALLTQLNAGTAIEILPEGSDLEPTVGTDYIKEFFLPGNTNNDTTRNTDYEFMRGIYQINIYTPKSKFRAYNKLKASEIKDIFPVGIQSNGNKITVESVSESRLFTDGGFLWTAISVKFLVVG